MVDVNLNPENRSENVRRLRRHLKLTQKEFIDKYLQDDNGKATMSVATLSNLETKGGGRINEVVTSVSGKLGLDPMIFSLEPEECTERFEKELKDVPNRAIASESNGRKGSINTLVNRLTMYFADRILSGDLKKGDQIPSDRELAKIMGVNRSAIREALKVLDIMGMIDIRPGQGMFVTQREANFFVIPLAWSLFLNGSQIKEILEVRNLLEIKAAKLAAENGSEQMLAKLTEIYYRSYKDYRNDDEKQFLEDDMEFHVCIAEASGNQVIYAMIQTIRNLLKRVSESGMADEDQMRQIYDEHKKIYGLIIARNPDEASEAMREHLDNSMKRYNYQ